MTPGPIALRDVLLGSTVQRGEHFAWAGEAIGRVILDKASRNTSLRGTSDPSSTQLLRRAGTGFNAMEPNRPCTKLTESGMSLSKWKHSPRNIPLVF